MNTFPVILPKGTEYTDRFNNRFTLVENTQVEIGYNFRTGLFYFILNDNTYSPCEAL